MAQQLILADGRRQDYLITGAKEGFPLHFIHGTPGAYTPNSGFSEACERKGVKVITMSRAGYGDSTRNKGRTVVDAIKDIEELNKHLGIERCFVGGWSGGGPHALACAARLPGCVAALCIAGCAPFDAEGLDWLAGQGQDNIEEQEATLAGEEALRAFINPQRDDILKLDGKGISEMLFSIFPPVDRAAIADHPKLSTFMAATFHEALKNGVDGWVDDNFAFIEPWGFELSEITVRVMLYQGDEDKMVPWGHGEWLAKHLPQKGLTKHLQKGEGHVSIFLPNMETMIDELLEVLKK